eukprot:EG_transcript_40884
MQKLLTDCQQNFQSVYQQIFSQEKKFGGLVEELRQGLAKVGGNTFELQKVLQDLQKNGPVHPTAEPRGVLQKISDMWWLRQGSQQPLHPVELPQPGQQLAQQPVVQLAQQPGQPAGQPQPAHGLPMGLSLPSAGQQQPL